MVVFIVWPFSLSKVMLAACSLCRTLGSIACIISERKNVHHSIIVSLDSHDNVELDAAIYAASLFAVKSKYVTFQAPCFQTYNCSCCVV